MARLYCLKLAAPAFVLIAALNATRTAAAATITFTVQPGSNLTLSGSYNNGSSTFSLLEQVVSSGSLVTTGSGTFDVDIDAGETQLAFLAGQSVAADFTAGGANFRPNNLPADWAFRVVTIPTNNGLFGALRDVTEEMTSGSLALTNVGPGSWQFNSTGVGVELTGGSLLTQAMIGGNPSGGVSSFSLVGETGSNTPLLPTATLVESAGQYTLTVPVDVTYVAIQSGQTFTMRLAGSLTAIAAAPPDPPPLVVVPEPSTLALAALAFLGLAANIRRRR